METATCEDSNLDKTNVVGGQRSHVPSTPERPTLPKRSTVTAKPDQSQNGRNGIKRGPPPLPSKPPNASLASKGEKPVPPTKPAIAAKPTRLSAKPVPSRKPIGVKVLPVPQKRPITAEGEPGPKTDSDVTETREIFNTTEKDQECAVNMQEPQRNMGVQVLPFSTKEQNENIMSSVKEVRSLNNDSATGSSQESPQVQPRPVPKVRPVPKKRKSIVKKEFESIALNISGPIVQETQINKEKESIKESMKLDDATVTASCDSSHTPVFLLGQTDDDKSRIKEASKSTEVVAKRKSFVPTRKAPPPPPMKPKVPNQEVQVAKPGNKSKLAKTNEQQTNSIVHKPTPNSQTATDAKTQITAQSQLSSSKTPLTPQVPGEENGDSPLRPPRPNRLKKRLSCEGLLSDMPNDIAQKKAHDAQSSQGSGSEAVKINDQSDENLKPKTPGKINIKQLAANLDTSAMKALKHQIETKNKQRPMTKGTSEDSISGTPELIPQQNKKLVDSNDNLTVESGDHNVSNMVEKEDPDGKVTSNNQTPCNVFSIIGMGAQDVFSHSFTNSNSDLSQESPTLARLKNNKKSRSNEDIATLRNQRLSRSHTVECLFDDSNNDDDVYEVIPDSPKSPLTPSVSQKKTPRRLSRSSSVGQLLDTPSREIIGVRRDKPVFVPPPPPPYTPPESASPRVAAFPLPFLMEKSFQTQSVSDEKLAHSPESGKTPCPKTSPGLQQHVGNIPDDDDDVYEDAESMEVLSSSVSKPVNDVPPALPRKESVRNANTSKFGLLSSQSKSPTKSSPTRAPAREPPLPPMKRPSTGRQESKTSIPSMEAPSVPSPLDDQVLPPDVQEDIYDDEGYLAPTRMPVPPDAEYSYADMPENIKSPTKPEPNIARKESIDRGGRQSVTSTLSTDSHIYESIGGKSNTASTDDKKEATNRLSRTSSKSSKDRESNISNLSRSIFYLEVDEEEKSKIEREMSQTDETNTQDQKAEDTYEIPPEFESYMGPKTKDADGSGVDLDVEVPVPPRPPSRKKKLTTGDNQTELVDDESEDDYIYPDAPEETEDEGKKKDKASDDEGYHYPADVSMEGEPGSPAMQTPPILPPRQKSSTSSPARTTVTGSDIGEKSPAPPPRSTSKSSSFSAADTRKFVGRSSSSVSSSNVGLSFKIPAIPPRQYNLEEEEGDYVVPPEPSEDDNDGVKLSIPLSTSFPVTLRNSHKKKKKRRSSHSGGSGDRPVSWASSEGMSSSPSSALTSSLHSPLSVSTASNGSGSSYINSGSSDEETDDENGETSAVDSGQDKARTEKKLFYIAQEIMTSERSFVDVLKLLNYDFRAAVDNANQEQATIPPQLLNQILKFLPQLHKFNKELLKDLKKRIDTWDKNPRIGDIFVTKGPFLKLYTSYIREFENMTTGLDDARRKYPEFDKVCSDFEKSERCSGLALKHYMLKPIQRIPQYRLLLQDYERHLPVGAADLQDTKMALVIVSEVAEHANQSMKYGDNFKKLWEIQHSLIGHFEVIKPGRSFIKEGILKKLSRKEMQPRMFYLLSDILLYTTPVSGGFRLNQAIPLTGMKVSLPGKEDFKNEFSLLSTQRSFTISASTPEERDEWLTALRAAIEDNVKRRQSFDVRALQRTMSVNVNIAVDKDFKLGCRAPVWVPDARVSMCMLCTAEFTVTFRRHHCRACGKVVCTFCSDYKAPLRYLEYKAARVCMECYDVLEKEIDAMDEELPPIMAGEKGTLKTNTTFTKASIKQKFKAIRWSSFRKSKHKRPAVLQEVAANADDADMSGYLKVWKGSKWKKLWFVLKGKALFTYKASEDAAAFESKVLLGYEVRTFNTYCNSTFYVDNGEIPKSKWFEGVEPNLVFEIIHQGTQPIIFRTESPNSRDRWISAMQKAMVP